MQILIAEDQAPSALFLRRTLERLGHTVSLAADGLTAWEAIVSGEVPVLISDWLMPRMDGLELCRKIRARKEGHYTYIILLTSKDCRDDRLEGLRNGADDFLTKPVDADELTVRLSVAGRILAVHDELARQNALLKELATIDELTGVKNRRRFREDLDIFFALAVRRGMPLSLLMLDVDNFKTYNDAFGHPAGDEILRSLAGGLVADTRCQDVVCRYGGEEFAILFPSTGFADASATAERLRMSVERRHWPLRPITVSIGVASTGTDMPDPGALVEAADRALYRAKRAGRNRVELHGPETVDSARQDRPN